MTADRPKTNKLMDEAAECAESEAARAALAGIRMDFVKHLHDAGYRIVTEADAAKLDRLRGCSFVDDYPLDDYVATTDNTGEWEIIYFVEGLLRYLNGEDEA